MSPNSIHSRARAMTTLSGYVLWKTPRQSAKDAKDAKRSVSKIPFAIFASFADKSLLLLPSPESQVRRMGRAQRNPSIRSEEHTSELQSLMRISYAVFCLKKKNTQHR